MTDVPINGAMRWKVRISAVLWFLLFVGFVLGVPVLISASPLILGAVALLALILALPVAWIIRRLFARQRRSARLASVFKAFAALLFSLTALVATPIYIAALFTELKPLTVPQATLSNGTKTVVFQGMMHIGSESFYKSVVYDLEEALTKDYVLYYEGVMPDPEGDAWFSETLAGGGDLSTNYKSIGSACGLSFQMDYFQLLTFDMRARPERHVNADVTTGDMMREYERLVAADPAFAAAVEADKAPEGEASESERMGDFFDWVASATPGQRELVGTVCRGFMTYQIGRKDDGSALNPIILDFRNQKLADRIVADSHDKIYMTYGAAHLPGPLSDLQKVDPAWEIKSLKWMRVISTPEELQGQL